MRIALFLSLLVCIAPDLLAQRPKPRKGATFIDRRPERPDILFRDAARHFKAGNLNEAEEVVRRNLEFFPDHIPSLALFAQMTFRKKQFEDTKRALTRALTLEPKNRTLNLMAANYFHKMDKPLAALEYMKRAESADPATGELSDLEAASDAGSLKTEIGKSVRMLKKRSPTFYSSTTDQPEVEMPVVETDRQLKIAVFHLKATGDSSSADPSLNLDEKLVSSFVNSRCFMVVERQQIDNILIEQDFQMTESVDPSTAAQVGQLVGVDVIAVGGLSKQSGQIEVDVRIVKVDTGVVLSAASVQYNRRSDLDNLVRSLASDLYR